MKFPLGLIVGFALGAGTVLMLQRLNEAIEDEDVESLSDRIDEQLARLEGKPASSPRPRPKPKPAQRRRPSKA